MAKEPQKPAMPEPMAKMLDQHVEYTPFLQKETIRLSPRTVISWLAKPTKKGERCTPEQALRFVMLCKARGLNPWEGDAYLVGYDTQDGPEFNLITSHQAFLKRAEVHPEYDGMESGVILRRADMFVEEPGDFFMPDDILVGGWARVHFKTRKHPIYRRLKLATYDKGFSRWKSDPAGMIVKCAEADALRSAFPNSLGGMYLDEEMGSAYAAPIIQSKTEQVKNRLTEALGNGDSNQTATEAVRSHYAKEAPPVEQEDDAGPIPPTAGTLPGFEPVGAAERQ